MQIDRNWLDRVEDDKGLTRGQVELLDIWCKGVPYVGKEIPDEVGLFIEKCRGYRPTYEYIKSIKMQGNYDGL